ncbi:hypothetical protein [Neorhodopirellula lusitana]|uniref:hypothetical protein n=1 Tax=Neorhodopirellula lusitana TaxID=445327 RepID=UPI00384A9A6B
MRTILALALAVVCSSLTLQADPPPAKDSTTPPTKLTPLMRMKLDKSKTILEGLTLQDYEKIASGASSLRQLSLESGWNVIQTREYAAQSRDFERAADLIVEAADAQDIHRATMGYVALTVRCVECHSYMRKHQMTVLKRQLDE